MKRIYTIALLAATLLAAGCDMESREAKKEHAAQTVTDFYMHIKNHEFDSAMRCTDLADSEAAPVADLFSQMGMEIHDFRVDTVILAPGDSLARVHVALRVSNVAAPDTADAHPIIPCVKTRDGWRVRFGF